MRMRVTSLVAVPAGTPLVAVSFATEYRYADTNLPYQPVVHTTALGTQFALESVTSSGFRLYNQTAMNPNSNVDVFVSVQSGC